MSTIVATTTAERTFTYLVNDIPRGASSRGLLFFLGSLVNGSPITDSQIDQCISGKTDSLPHGGLIKDFQDLVDSATIADSRLDDELSVATLRFKEIPRWFKNRENDPYGFPKKTRLGTIWKGVDMTKKDGDGRTAFIRAVRDGNLQLAETLAEYDNTDVNAQDNKGMTALHWACTEGLTSLTAFCLSITGLDISLKCKAGNTAFGISYREALLNDNHTIPTLFYQNMFEMDEYDPDNALLRLLTLTSTSGTRTRLPQAALFSPCRNGNLALVRVLLQTIHFDGPSATTENMETALHLACINGHVEIVTLLLDRADDYGFDINAKTKEGCTALHYAAQYNYTQIMTILLQRKASITIVDRFGRTALHVAAEYGFESALRLLFNMGAEREIWERHGLEITIRFYIRCGIEFKKSKEKKAFWSTTRKKITNCQDLMLFWGTGNILITQKPAQITEVLQGGVQITATVTKDIVVVQPTEVFEGEQITAVITEDIVMTQSTDEEQVTCMITGENEMIQARKKSAEIRMSRLLGGTEDSLDKEDNAGLTALHKAAFSQDVEVVELLLERGANIEQRFWTWRTALEIAEDMKNREIVRLLRSRGAKSSHENAYERLPEEFRSSYQDFGLGFETMDLVLHQETNDDNRAEMGVIETTIFQGANMGASQRETVTSTEISLHKEVNRGTSQRGIIGSIGMSLNAVTAQDIPRPQEANTVVKLGLQGMPLHWEPNEKPDSLSPAVHGGALDLIRTEMSAHRDVEVELKSRETYELAANLGIIPKTRNILLETIEIDYELEKRDDSYLDLGLLSHEETISDSSRPPTPDQYQGGSNHSMDYDDDVLEQFSPRSPTSKNQWFQGPQSLYVGEDDDDPYY